MKYILPVLFFGYSFCFIGGFFGNIWWGFDLLSHFRFQYLWIAFIFLPLLTWRGHIWMTALMVVFVLVNGALMTKVLFSSPITMVKPAQTVRIMYGNIKYDQVDPIAVAKSINLASPDVVVLTEIQENDYQQLLPLIQQFRYSYFMPALGAFDIAVLSRVELIEEPEFIFQQEIIPYVRVEVPTPNGSLTVFGVHPAPPVGGQSHSFLREYEQFISQNPELESSTAMIKEAASSSLTGIHTQLRDEYIEQVFMDAADEQPSMIIGDLNITSFSPKFQNWKDRSGMIDTQDEFGLQPTWPTWLPAFMRIPLDHVLVSQDVILYNRWLGVENASDHMPVVVDVGL